MGRTIVIIILVVLVLLSILILNGFGATGMTIRKLHQNPEKYTGQEVIVSGNVARITDTPYLIGFLLEDETGDNSIFIKIDLEDKEMLPEIEDKVKVTGEFRIAILRYHIQATKIELLGEG